MKQTHEDQLVKSIKDSALAVISVSGEQIAGAMLSTLALDKRPVGSLSLREREVATRQARFQNAQARRRIELQDKARLYPKSLCPVHLTRYFILTGDRMQDCFFCRQARENREAEEKAAWLQESRPWDDFRQTSAMEDDAGGEEETPAPLEERRPQGLVTLLASALIITVCIILIALIYQAMRTPS